MSRTCFINRVSDEALAWPDRRDDDPPRDHPYRAATWLLGRHPRLAHLAARIRSVIFVDERTAN
jgi:hypothetical protein